MKNGHDELNRRLIYLLLFLTAASSGLLGSKLNNTGNVISPGVPPDTGRYLGPSTVQGIAKPLGCSLICASNSA